MACVILRSMGITRSVYNLMVWDAVFKSWMECWITSFVWNWSIEAAWRSAWTWRPFDTKVFPWDNLCFSYCFISKGTNIYTDRCSLLHGFRIQQEFKSGEEYWALERKLCHALSNKNKVTGSGYCRKKISCLFLLYICSLFHVYLYRFVSKMWWEQFIWSLLITECWIFYYTSWEEKR